MIEAILRKNSFRIWKKFHKISKFQGNFCPKYGQLMNPYLQRILLKRQRPDQVIDIQSWEFEDETGIFPKGSREKRTLFCPEIPPFPFLIPGHRYLFKESVRRHPGQFWVEIAAYRLGTLMGVAVPPAFVALDREGGKAAALIEWFYDYPGETRRYVDGGSYMVRHIHDYDLKRGRQHNFKTISIFFRGLQWANFLSANWIHHWAKIFTFDAIIGNTDRHHDNWGLIWDFQTNFQIEKATMAPAFDNGTSMGYEILDEKITLFDNEEHLRRYVFRGRHHIKWDEADERSCQHFELLRKFKDRFPSSVDTIIGCLLFRIEDARTLLSELTEFDVPVKFSQTRVDFILRMIDCRRHLILESLA